MPKRVEVMVPGLVGGAVSKKKKGSTQIGIRALAKKKREGLFGPSRFELFQVDRRFESLVT